MPMSNILNMDICQVRGRLNQCQIIMIIAVAINKLDVYIRTDYFKSVNLHLHHLLNFHDCVKNISTTINTGKRAYLRTHGGSCYNSTPDVWKIMDVETTRKLISLTDILCLQNQRLIPPGKRWMFC